MASVLKSKRQWVIALALCLALLPGAALADDGTYIVKVGDTLASIAQAFGTTATAIMQANDISDPNVIRPGQKLTIPAADAAKPTDADASTAKSVRYTVAPGDTLASIAARYKVSAAAILQANNLGNPNVLPVGTTLIIPGATDTANTAIGPVNTAPKKAPGEGGSYNSFGGGPQTYLDKTRFAVSISRQHCWLIQNDVVTDSVPCSTGRKHYETPPGFYKVQSKMPVAYGDTWDFYMPYWLGLYSINDLENGIHGLPYNKWGYTSWKEDIGTPITFGCIVLDDDIAKKLYQIAYIGMQVIILE